MEQGLGCTSGGAKTHSQMSQLSPGSEQECEVLKATLYQQTASFALNSSLKPGKGSTVSLYIMSCCNEAYI